MCTLLGANLLGAKNPHRAAACLPASQQRAEHGRSVKRQGGAVLPGSERVLCLCRPVRSLLPQEDRSRRGHTSRQQGEARGAHQAALRRREGGSARPGEHAQRACRRSLRRGLSLRVSERAGSKRQLGPTLCVVPTLRVYRKATQLQRLRRLSSSCRRYVRSRTALSSHISAIAIHRLPCRKTAS